jgi:hypothetical protein
LPPLTAVSGTITIDGKPASGVSVIFLPQAGTKGDGASGVTDNDGHYVLKHRSGKDGIQPGDYSVIFSKYSMPDGTPVAGDIQPESVGAKQVIPVRYTSPETSQSNGKVTDSASTIDFDLKSR